MTREIALVFLLASWLVFDTAVSSAIPAITSINVFTDNRPFDDPFGVFGYNLSLQGRISDPLGVPNNISSFRALNLTTGETRDLFFAANEQTVLAGLYTRFLPFSPNHIGQWRFIVTNNQGAVSFLNSHNLDKPVQLPLPSNIKADVGSGAVNVTLNPVPGADSYALEIHQRTPSGLVGLSILSSDTPSFQVPNTTFTSFPPGQQFVLRVRANDFDFTEPVIPRVSRLENRSVNAVDFVFPPARHTIYLNFDEATVLWASNIFHRLPTQFTKPAFNPLPTNAFPDRESLISHIVNIVRNDFQNFSVDVVTQKPSGLFGITTVHIGGTPDLVGQTAGTEGLAPVIFSRIDQLIGTTISATALAFQNVNIYDTDFARDLADTIAHEAGHTLGLLHLKDTPADKFIMETTTDQLGVVRQFSNTPQPADLGLLGFLGITQNDSFQLAKFLGFPKVNYGSPGSIDSVKNALTGIRMLPRRTIFNPMVFLSRNMDNDIVPTLLFEDSEIDAAVTLQFGEDLLPEDRLIFLGSSQPNGVLDIFALNTPNGFDPTNLSEDILRTFSLPIGSLPGTLTHDLFSFETGLPVLIGSIESTVTEIPEPSTFSLLILGLIGVILAKKWCRPSTTEFPVE